MANLRLETTDCKQHKHEEKTEFKQHKRVSSLDDSKQINWDIFPLSMWFFGLIDFVIDWTLSEIMKSKHVVKEKTNKWKNTHTYIVYIFMQTLARTSQKIRI